MAFDPVDHEWERCESGPTDADRVVLLLPGRSYLQYLGRSDSPADRLCNVGVPAWVVHAEKGDGGLTDAERRTLEECPNTSVITIPGTSFFLPNEEPERIAGVVVDALEAR